MALLRNEVAAHTLGTNDLAYSPVELLPTCRDPHLPQRILLVRQGGAIRLRRLRGPDRGRVVWA